MGVLHTFDRWLYRGGRPNRLARLINRIRLPARLRPKQLAYLEVRGRRTGRVISFPVVVTDHEGERSPGGLSGPTRLS